MIQPHSVLVSVGSYLPQKILTNKDLEKIVDTTDEWIQERSGIQQRHCVADDEFTSHLAIKAALDALKNSNIHASSVDCIIVATSTPDSIMPSVAARVQHAIGAKNAFAFDITAACSGFIYALSVADQFIKSGQSKKVMVIGAESMTRLIDWTDRTTCVLFGDGAGAFILESQENTPNGILGSLLKTDGSMIDMLYVDGGIGSTKTHGYLKMQGREVFKSAVNCLSQIIVDVLKVANLSENQVDWLVPHQANQRIIDAMAKKISLPPHKVISTIAKHGNTSAASIPLAFDIAWKDGRIKKNDIVLMEAMGSGLTWGACILRV